MGTSFHREDVKFYSKGTECAAWLYLPDTDEAFPVIVMANGLGGTREMRLYEYAERFAKAGFACFLFDYRNFGASGGKKRQLINAKMQLADWQNAIEAAKRDPRIDGNRLLLFGGSFSGGHVIWLSAHRTDVQATVAQCPYTNTMATLKQVGLVYILKKIPLIIADLFTCVTGYHPLTLPLFSSTGKNAFLIADASTIKGFVGDAEYINASPARSLLEFFKYSPGKFFAGIHTPIYVAVCLKDAIAPACKTIQLAANAEKATVKEYDCGHFDIFFGSRFEEAITDYLAFFEQNGFPRAAKPETAHR